MRSILPALVAVAMLAACTPQPLPADHPEAQSQAETQQKDSDARLREALAAVGSSTAEFHAFLDTGDPALVHRLVDSSERKDSFSSTYVNHLQRIALRMDRLGVPPARFRQLCDGLRFVYLDESDALFFFERVYGNVCLRGEAAATVAAPPPPR